MTIAVRVLVLVMAWSPAVAPASADTGRGLVIYLIDETGGLRGIERAAPDVVGEAEAVLARAGALALAGPTEAERQRGFRSALPPGTTIDETRVRDDQGGYFISLPASFLEDLTVERAQVLADLFAGLDRNVPQIHRHVLMIRDPEDGRHHPLPHFLTRPTAALPKPDEDAPTSRPRVGQPPAPGQDRPPGYLDGKSVFVNPGHGWYYNTGSGSWVLQRGNLYNLIEDHSNAEAVDTYLIHYLWNAGAGVYTCRERDLNPNRVIVDDSDPGFSTTGAWTLDGASGYGGSSLRTPAAIAESATATFTPTIPADGYYHVSIWYEGGTANADGVRITVRHAGGETSWIQNQKRDGYTWKDIGRFYFRAGSSPSAGSVTLSNASDDVGLDVVADAVRFGGGVGVETPFGEPAGSGKPRFEEAGPYHARRMGCDAATCGSSTVLAMPQYAKWESEAWEDSVYVSWHSNASSGTTRGTSSFAYASGGWDAPFDGVPGSLELRDLVHAELINDLRLTREIDWRDVGTHTQWFGEINPTYNDEMPGALFEMAFHDNIADVVHLKDPVFRQVVARAVYQGIVRYFAGRDGDPGYTLLPEPPTNLRVRNDGTGSVVLAWDAPPFDPGDGLLGDAATGYRVYRSLDGRGFDDGIAVSGGATTTWTDATAEPGETWHYRVTATNAGGESFPTETLSARVSGSVAPLLVVAGFDRLDGSLSVVQDDPQYGWVARGDVERMNAYRYTATYAGAIAAQGVAFDSTSNEAVIDGQVGLDDYASVVWFCGEEGSTDHTFDAAEQALAQSFLSGGGNLLVSGADIGWDLDAHGNGVAFYNDQLRASYVADDAGTYTVDAVPGGIFDGNGTLTFDDGTHGEYDANYPDVIDPTGGAIACLDYGGGTNHAAIQYDGGTHKVVNLAFPFESIVSAAAREALMADVLDFFGVLSPAPPPVPDGVFGLPLVPRRLDPAGSSLELVWDAALCPAPAYHLVYGALSAVASYATDGSLCALSPTGTDVWTGVPAGDLWFLVLSSDGARTEGDWGEATPGPRHAGLPSGACSTVTRDDAGVCP